jgi:hypothetical protein
MSILNTVLNTWKAAMIEIVEKHLSRQKENLSSYLIDEKEGDYGRSNALEVAIRGGDILPFPVCSSYDGPFDPDCHHGDQVCTDWR